MECPPPRVRRVCIFVAAGRSIATLRIFAGIGLRTPGEWRPVTVRSVQRLCDRPLTRLTLLTCDGACVARLARFLVWRRPRRRGDAPPRLRPATGAVRRARLAGDVLHDRDGALAHERHWNRVGADTVARDAAGGLGGAPSHTGLKCPATNP